MKRFVPLLLALPLLAACSSNAISSSAHTTFLDSDDLIKMTDKMAASFAGNPLIAAQQAPLVIVIKPIHNSTNQIIPANEKLLYVARMEDLMASKPGLAGRFKFVLTQEDYLALQQKEGKSPGELGPDPARNPPDYALSGEFQVLTNDDGTKRSDFYYCRYTLLRITGPDSGTQIWTDNYQVKKVAAKEFLD